MSVMLKVIIDKFDVKTYEDLTQIIEMLIDSALAGKELAEQASDAEVVGGITVNKDAIRKAADLVFECREKLLQRVKKTEGETYEEGIRRIIKEGREMWAKESLDVPEEVEAPPLVVEDILKKSRR